MENITDNWDYLITPNVPLRIFISGDIPDSKDGLPMQCSFFSGTTSLFSATGTWQIQGQSSLGSLKKNWKLKLQNPNTGNKLQVKFGDWFPMSSITLKGYGTDRTLLRDSLTTELWRKMYSTHFDGFLASSERYDYFKFQNCSSMTSALFSTSGYPIELYRNNDFFGLYVLRVDPSNKNNLLDNQNPNHIQMQPRLPPSNFWSTGILDRGYWGFYSPEVVLDSTYQKSTRLLQWSADCVNNRKDMRATYKNYINLDSFIDYILLCEVVASYDSINNNIEFQTWNGKVWYVFPYDEDLTFGLIYAKSSVDATDPSKIGWVLGKGSIADQNPIFFQKFYEVFFGEIRDRYYYLRNNKILDVNVFSKMIKQQVSLINPDLMKKDLSLWNTNGPTGVGTGNFVSDNGKKWSFEYIKYFFEARLEWLDQQFNI